MTLRYIDEERISFRDFIEKVQEFNSLSPSSLEKDGIRHFDHSWFKNLLRSL